jgi:hypothetical protein
MEPEPSRSDNGLPSVFAAQQVARLELSGRRIEFIVRITEAEAYKNSLGPAVVWVMPGVQTGDPKSRERARDHGFRGLTSIASVPKHLAELETELIYTVIRLVRLKAAAAHVLSCLQQKDGPILEFVLVLIGDLPCETLAYLCWGEWATGQPRHLRITP